MRKPESSETFATLCAVASGIFFYVHLVALIKLLVGVFHVETATFFALYASISVAALACAIFSDFTSFKLSREAFITSLKNANSGNDVEIAERVDAEVYQSQRAIRHRRWRLGFVTACYLLVILFTFFYLRQ